MFEMRNHGEPHHDELQSAKRFILSFLHAVLLDIEILNDWNFWHG